MRMKVVERHVKDLIEAEYNPRILREREYKDLRESLERFGMIDPLIINMHPDRENIIIGGHQRFRIWREMGKRKVPTVEVRLTIERERELNIRLNKNVGEWDYDILANAFDEQELLEWGFNEYDLGLEMPQDVDDVWKEMPEFEAENQKPFHQITVRFVSEKDYTEFAKLIGQRLTNDTKSIWIPKIDQDSLDRNRRIAHEDTVDEKADENPESKKEAPAAPKKKMKEKKK